MGGLLVYLALCLYGTEEELPRQVRVGGLLGLVYPLAQDVLWLNDCHTVLLQVLYAP